MKLRVNAEKGEFEINLLHRTPYHNNHTSKIKPNSLKNYCKTFLSWINCVYDYCECSGCSNQNNGKEILRYCYILEWRDRLGFFPI
jgi:hypothetical protein